jgi:hypothetical protein
MEQVHPGGLRLRLVLGGAVAVAAGIIGATAAAAAITPAVPPASTISTAMPVSNFAGEVIGTVSDGGACESTAAASTSIGTPSGGASAGASIGVAQVTGTCSSHIVEVVNAGRVEVQVDWIGDLSDLDLYVYRCAAPIERVPVIGTPANPQDGDGCDTLVASSTDTQPPSVPLEQVRFDALAGTAYEIRVVPFFAFVTQPYTGCVAYVTAGGCPGGPDGEEEPPPPPPNGDPATDFTAGCSSGATSAKVKGGGAVALVDGVLKGRFSINADVRSREDVAGKIVYTANDARDLRFSGTRITCAGSASYLVDGPGYELRGYGNVVETVDGQSTTRKVCFRSIARGDSLPLFGLTIYELAATGTCDTSRVVYSKDPTAPVSGTVYKLL